jgi:hypothetical protein
MTPTVAPGLTGCPTEEQAVAKVRRYEQAWHGTAAEDLQGIGYRSFHP